MVDIYNGANGCISAHNDSIGPTSSDEAVVGSAGTFDHDIKGTPIFSSEPNTFYDTEQNCGHIGTTTSDGLIVGSAGTFDHDIKGTPIFNSETNVFYDYTYQDCQQLNKEFLGNERLSDSWSNLRSDINEINSFVNDHFYKVDSSFFFETSEVKTNNYKSKLNSVLDSKAHLNKKWAKIELLYENFRNHYNEFFHNYFEDGLKDYFYLEKLIAPLQNHINRVRNRFSQLIEFTNKLSKLIHESVDLEDQRLGIRKIYGFLFKNLDDESGSDRKLKGIRKQPTIAFCNYIYNSKRICGHYYEERKIDHSFKKNTRRK